MEPSEIAGNEFLPAILEAEEHFPIGGTIPKRSSSRPMVARRDPPAPGTFDRMFLSRFLNI
jgi:hypothetical protein